MEHECFQEYGLCHGIGLTSLNTNFFMNLDCVSWNRIDFMEHECFHGSKMVAIGRMLFMRQNRFYRIGCFYRTGLFS